MRPLVILRPEAGGRRSLGRARALGLAARHVPLFAIVPLDWALPDAADFDGVVLTSANAVRFAGPALQGLRHLPAYAVGETTAAAASEAGFEVAATGSGGIAGLDLPAQARLLHLCGRNHQAIPGTTALPVYAAEAVDPSPDLGDLAGSVVAVHSPRAGKRLAELVADRTRIVIAAISPLAATACGTGWQEVAVAAQPSDAALLALAAELCESRGR